MLQPILDGTTVPLLEKAAAFGERRQQVLAGNVANIDTPDYRMRDLPVAAFEQALQKAVAARQQNASPGGAASAGTHAPREVPLAELFPEELFRAVEAPPRGLTFHDANNRSIETQVMEMTRNALLQRFAVEVMTAQFNQLEAVIAGRP